MATPTALFAECRAVYDSLPHRKTGDHGRTVRGRYVKDGEVIGAFVPWTTQPVMELLTDAKPDRLVIALNIPGLSSQVNVFAVPASWPHGKTVDGATETEVRKFLERITQLKASAKRRK